MKTRNMVCIPFACGIALRTPVKTPLRVLMYQGGGTLRYNKTNNKILDRLLLSEYNSERRYTATTTLEFFP